MTHQSLKSECKFLPGVKKEVGDEEVDVLNHILNLESYEINGFLPKDDTEDSLPVEKIPQIMSEGISNVSKGVPKTVCEEISKKVSKEFHKKAPKEFPKEVPEVGPKTALKERPREENILEAGIEHAQPKICRTEVHKSQTSGNHLRNDFVLGRRDINERKRPATSSQAVIDEEYDPLNPSFSSSQGFEPLAKKAAASNFQTPSSLPGAMDEANVSVYGKDETILVYQPTPLQILAVSRENGKNAIKVNDHNNNKLVRSEENQMKHQQLLSLPAVSNLTLSKKYVTQQPEASIAESAKVLKDLVNIISDNANKTPAEKRSNNLATSHQSNSYVHRLTSTGKPTNSDTLFGKSLSKKSDSHDLSQFDQISRSQVSLQQKQQGLSKMQNLLKRCQLWPVCKNNSNCPYHQPKALCKAFPNCKFLGTCLYIHPKCKFDPHCIRDNCPYSHANKENVMPMTNSKSSVRSRTVKKRVIPQSCKFYPNCKAYRCPYLHPKKKCRFGTNCTALNCPFLHQSFPVQGKFKWISSHS